MQDERPVGKARVGQFVEAAVPGLRDEALGVKLIVDRIGFGPTGVELRPDLGKPVVVGSSALRTGPVARRQRRRLVEEE